jgi:hypothetical protein
MRFLSYIFIIIFLCIVSCSNISKKKKYNFVIDKYPNLLNCKFYLLLPEEPCVSCKSISYEFVKQVFTSYNDSINYDNILRVFFLNKTENELINKHNFSKTTIENKNIIINPGFSNNNDSSLFTYPTIIYLNNNRITKIEKQNANNPYALQKLNQKIRFELYEEN